jgi:hypothetical protein
MATTLCPGCGAPVPPRTGRPGKRRKWCSEACRVRTHREANPYTPRPPREVACATCGRPFASTTRAAYCSDECRADGRRRAHRERRSARTHP